MKQGPRDDHESSSFMTLDKGWTPDRPYGSYPTQVTSSDFVEYECAVCAEPAREEYEKCPKCGLIFRDKDGKLIREIDRERNVYLLGDEDSI